MALSSLEGEGPWTSFPQEIPRVVNMNSVIWHFGSR